MFGSEAVWQVCNFYISVNIPYFSIVENGPIQQYGIHEAYHMLENAFPAIFSITMFAHCHRFAMCGLFL